MTENMIVFSCFPFKLAVLLFSSFGVLLFPSKCCLVLLPCGWCCFPFLFLCDVAARLSRCCLVVLSSSSSFGWCCSLLLIRVGGAASLSPSFCMVLSASLSFGWCCFHPLPRGWCCFALLFLLCGVVFLRLVGVVLPRFFPNLNVKSVKWWLLLPSFFGVVLFFPFLSVVVLFSCCPLKITNISLLLLLGSSFCVFAIFSTFSSFGW